MRATQEAEGWDRIFQQLPFHSFNGYNTSKAPFYLKYWRQQNAFN